MEHFHPYLDYLSHNPYSACCIIYAFGLLSSLVGIGLVIPNVVVLISLGVWIGLGKLPIITTLLGLITGTLTGSTVSFWIGYHYQELLRTTWVYSRYLQVFLQTERFFKKLGVLSIFLGRLMGPLKAFLPLIAGLSRMHPSHFFIADISSAIVWTVFYLTSGIYLGRNALNLMPYFPFISNMKLGIIHIISFLGLAVGACFIMFLIKRTKK